MKAVNDFEADVVAASAHYSKIRNISPKLIFARKPTILA